MTLALGPISFANTLSKGVPAPYPAPAGYRWDFVTSMLNSSRITDMLTGAPVVALRAVS